MNGVRAEGFSLIEMILAMALTLMAASASLAIVASARRAATLQPALADRQQRLRVATAVIAADVGAAGAPAVNATDRVLGRIIPVVLPFRAGPSRPERSDAFRADTLTVVSVEPSMAEAVLDEPLAPGDPFAVIRLVPGCPVLDAARDPSCGFTRAASALVVDASGSYDHLRIGGAIANRLVIEPGGPVRSRTYPAGSWIVPIAPVTYYRNAGTSQLMRYNGRESDAPALDLVTDLRFEYFGVSLSGGELVELTPAELTDGPWRPDAVSGNRYDADLLRIRRVRIALRLGVASPPDVGDVAWTVVVSPRSLEGTP